ncbi:FtsX-like permease family protein [Rugosimonospora africana]|uniref:ABC3 transporter permease C-terminal domain-containing protein n=1 Tax=Rugosimonospora africana TaxID=556532 RepID=A0A8J3VV52_9ACTN|nr:FtsX-like permease family protein [Rugosimonospora africana]GIH19915.1 hypothetical protein Raf01_80870 [Rugosimonospora africana]
MIRLGLRLAVTGGREAIARLVIITAAVALGAGMLLVVLAGINAVNTQNFRYAWLNAGAAASTGAAPATSADPLWWSANGDYFHRQLLGRIEVAPTGPTSPVPPGIPRLPGPGEYYASPELSKLMRTTPAGQLADRFPGHQIGTIGDAALPAPNSLIIIIGDRPDQLAHVSGAMRITSIPDVSPSDCIRCVIGVNASGMDLVLSVVAGALLFPVLMFIGTATRLSAARREQRFAAMRLVGATPRQISTISVVESTVAATAGVALGFALFYLFRDPLAAFPFTGAPFFPSDLSLGVLDILGVAVGVPVAAALAARLALRRVRISPLGVTRRVTPKPPRVYRLIPLLAGFGELAYVLAVGPPRGNSLAQVEVFLPGFLVVMAGLVIAGPWLTMVGTRVVARRAKRPATLIAARRLSDDPKAGFRAISGLMLALFVTSVAVGVITTIVAHRGTPTTGTAVTTLVDNFTSGHTDSGQMLTSVPPTPDPVPAALRSVPGVRAVAVVRLNPDNPPPMQSIPGPTSVDAMLWEPGLVSCAELSASHAFGRCEPGASVAAVNQDLRPTFDASPVPGQTVSPVTTQRYLPTADVSPDRLAQLPVMSINVDTDGSPATIEAARTILENAYPGNRIPATEADFDADFSRDLVGWQQLANVVILTSLPIAGCSLAVSVAGGLSDRKRPFSLLRLSGVPLAMLRRVIALETAVPLLVVAVVATGAGFLAAHLFLRAQLGYTLLAPGVEYYVIVLVGLAASVGIVASTLPLLRRITGPETARNE